VKTRSTIRRKACLKVLGDRICLLPELRWRVWSSELASGSTKVVCPRSTDYRLSFEKSLTRWEEQGVLHSSRPDTLNQPITYGMAARLAVYTVLERGQLSGDRPEKRIRLYFTRTCCSVVVACDDGLAANLGAVFVGSLARYRILSDEPFLPSMDLSSLSIASWKLLDAVSGKKLDPFDKLPTQEKQPFRTRYGELVLEESESRAPEGVALAVKHQYPGGISPYLLPGELSTHAFAPTDRAAERRRQLDLEP